MCKSDEMKIFIFVIHGAAYSQVIQNVKNQNMRNFQKVMENGSYGVCKSVFSTCSAVDYTSMITGCTNEKHGISHFFTNVMEGFYFSHYPKDGRIELVPPKFWATTRVYMSYDVKVPFFWDLLKDKRCISMGLFTPTTYPALPMPNDGIMVSGCWAKPSPFLKDLPCACNNPDVREELLQCYPDYWISAPRGIPPFYPPGVDDEFDYLKEKVKIGLELDKKEFNARYKIFKNQDWNLFLVESQYNDPMEHDLWPRSKENPLFDPDVDPKLEKLGLLDKVWHHTDEIFGKFLSNLASDTNVIIISNHGEEEINYLSYAHDVFLRFADMGIIGPPPGWKIRLEMPKWAPPRRANHNYNGIFIASGPNLRKKGEIKKAISVMDLVPIILKIFNKKIPPHIDGKLPKGLLL